MNKLLSITLVSLLGLSLTSCKVKKMEPIDYALTQFGIGENGESWTNPEILKYMDETGFNNQDATVYSYVGDVSPRVKFFHVSADSAAHHKWCAPFVEWALEKAGYFTSHSLSAAELAASMEPIAYEEAKRGDVVILKGHIAFLWEKKPGDVFVMLGGDQALGDHETRVSFLPMERKDVLGVFRPVKDPRGLQNMKHKEMEESRLF